jgi:hypothetical protein
MKRRLGLKQFDATMALVPVLIIFARTSQLAGR